ncbi:uncharacterized protein LOC142354648 [Convolutriloba macropyga]|uniref:uncharacterized protein LOC142354648 n=1 Tax=Convolutriloba macropyga TaxID=536237 RepID=UPI003F51B39A
MTTEKPNLSVHAWINYLNGTKSNQAKTGPENPGRVQNENKDPTTVLSRDANEKNAPRSKPDSKTKKDTNNSGRKSRIQSASGRNLSQEAKLALQDMGFETDETNSDLEDNSRPISPAQFFAPKPEETDDDLSPQKEDELNTSRHSAAKTETDRSQDHSVFRASSKANDQSSSNKESSNKEGSIPAPLSDRERIYVPLETTYRSELRKITGRMGVELDAINSMNCTHRPPSRANITSSPTPFSKYTSVTGRNRNPHLYANLPSCARCRQQYFTSCLQNKPQTVQKYPMPDLSFKSPLTPKNVLAFNTSAPRRSFVDILPGKGDNSSQHNSRSQSASPVRRLQENANPSRNLTKHANESSSRNYSATHRKKSSTPTPTKLVDANPQNLSPLKQQNANRTTIITKNTINNHHDRASPKNSSPLSRRKQNSASGQLVKHKFVSETMLSANKKLQVANPPSSRKFEKTSAKLNEIERLKQNNENKSKPHQNSSKQGREKPKQLATLTDRRFETAWDRPWNEGESNEDELREAAFEEIPEELRKQSVAKCKEWLALWFSAHN